MIGPSRSRVAVSDQKISLAVMQVGANDRQAIREGDVTHEPFSERWREIYRQRIDDIASQFAEKRVPLIWVGLPPMQNRRLSADMVSLNELVRERIERAGARYVDIWEGSSTPRTASPLRDRTISASLPGFVRPMGCTSPVPVRARPVTMSMLPQAPDRDRCAAGSGHRSAKHRAGHSRCGDGSLCGAGRDGDRPHGRNVANATLCPVCRGQTVGWSDHAIAGNHTRARRRVAHLHRGDAWSQRNHERTRPRAVRRSATAAPAGAGR